MKMGRASLFCAGVGAMTFWTTVAFAQTEEERDSPTNRPAYDSSEIVVTAQRRAENVQDVPIAISVASGEQLAVAGIGDTLDLQNIVPGLKTDAKQSAVQPFIRGVGINSQVPGTDAPIAIYVDDVYIMAPAGSNFALNSIERVEVLKGPQGTLFGRNASAGVLNVVTRSPTSDNRLDADIAYGSYETLTGRIYGNARLGEGVAANIAAYYSKQHEGWGYNYLTNREFRRAESTNIRGKLKVDFSASTSLLVTGWYSDFENDTSTYVVAPGALARGGYRNPYDFFSAEIQPAPVRSKSYGASAKFEHDMGWATLVNIAAHQTTKTFAATDADGGPNNLSFVIYDWTTKGFTNELQLVSADSSSFEWIAGVFYLNQDVVDLIYSNGGTLVPAQPNGAIGSAGSESIAGFAQGTLHLGDRTHLTAGLRYTHDKRNIDEIQLASAVQTPWIASSSWSKLTWRFSLAQDLGDDIMAYASYNRGYKAGAYGLPTPQLPPVDPEQLDAFEAGLKMQLFDRRLMLNLAGFYYDYKNMVVRSIVPGTVGVVGISNAASSEIYGLDVDFDARVTERFNISGGFELLHARFSSYPLAPISTPNPAGGNFTALGDVSGNTLVFAPDFSGNIGVSYDAPLGEGAGRLRLGSNLSYHSKFYFDPDNRLAQPGYATLNASIGWTAPSKRWEVELWAKNLTDKRYFADATSPGVADLYVPGAPRTIGVRLRVMFGDE